MVVKLKSFYVLDNLKKIKQQRTLFDNNLSKRGCKMVANNADYTVSHKNRAGLVSSFITESVTT